MTLILINCNTRRSDRADNRLTVSPKEAKMGLPTPCSQTSARVALSLPRTAKPLHVFPYRRRAFTRAMTAGLTVQRVICTFMGAGLALKRPSAHQTYSAGRTGPPLHVQPTFQTVQRARCTLADNSQGSLCTFGWHSRTYRGPSARQAYYLNRRVAASLYIYWVHILRIMHTTTQMPKISR